MKDSGFLVNIDSVDVLRPDLSGISQADWQIY